MRPSSDRSFGRAAIGHFLKSQDRYDGCEPSVHGTGISFPYLENWGQF